jgi:light-regulated signal transduction histidine kinase (bacteriophytochrome)
MENPDELNRVFISLAVHDLREPLRSIGVNADVLAGLESAMGDESSAECVRFIQGSVDRMDLLLRDIGEYCFVQGQAIQVREIDMNAVWAEAVRQASPELKASDAVVTQDSLPAVQGDFFALAKVFRGLIANACRFRAAENPRIHAGVEYDETESRFFVRDNGLGFDPVHAAKIFQPFQRLHGKKYSGSGLGLPLAKRIVEQHGGKMWAESPPFAGSVFWFSLPNGRS